MTCLEPVVTDQLKIETCGKNVGLYRQCGRGAASSCKITIGFCEEHGGDERAEKLIRAHHEAAHPDSL